MSWFSKKKKPDESELDLREVAADLQRALTSIKEQADAIKREKGQAYWTFLDCDSCGRVGMLATAKYEPQTGSCPRCQRPLTIRTSDLQVWG